MTIIQELAGIIKKYEFYIIYDDDDNENNNKITYICYNKETKNIKKIKELVEMSGNYQWWYNDSFNKYKKYTLAINKKPISIGSQINN